MLSTWKYGEFIVPFCATVIALLTAFSTFFSWDQTWKTNYTSAHLVGNALATWKAKMLRAKYHQDPEIGIELAHEAYEVLIESINSIWDMHLTGPTTRCSVPKWKIIQKQSSNFKNGLRQMKRASAIWNHFVGQTVSSVRIAVMIKNGKRMMACTSAENVDGEHL
jgi:hypothetical protein